MYHTNYFHLQISWFFFDNYLKSNNFLIHNIHAFIYSSNDSSDKLFMQILLSYNRTMCQYLHENQLIDVECQISIEY